MMAAVEKGVVQSHTVNTTVCDLAVCTLWVTRLFDNCRHARRLAKGLFCLLFAESKL